MIQWNQYTWYSKLLALVLFIGVLPAWTFFLGTQYQKTIDVQTYQLSPTQTIATSNVMSGSTGSAAGATNSGASSVTSVTTVTTSTSTVPAVAPKLTGINPSTGPVGSSVTITGTNFASNDNTILFNGYKVGTAVSTVNGTKLTFTVPNSGGADCKAGQACPMYAILLKPGTYLITVETPAGKSNQISFAITQ